MYFMYHRVKKHMSLSWHHHDWAPVTGINIWFELARLWTTNLPGRAPSYPVQLSLDLSCCHVFLPLLCCWCCLCPAVFQRQWCRASPVLCFESVGVCCDPAQRQTQSSSRCWLELMCDSLWMHWSSELSWKSLQRRRSATFPCCSLFAAAEWWGGKKLCG